MRTLLFSCALAVSVVLLFSHSVKAQNIEAGGHVGLGVLGSEGPRTSPETNTGLERGLWFILQATPRWSIAADWSYIPRDEFLLDEPSPVGESGRNRQYVDVTLQYHFQHFRSFKPFVEIGGGAHWNNRNVSNPGGVPDFEEQGKESTRFGVWTVGGGIRRRIAPHLNWIAEAKAHNLGRDGKDGFRLFTGLTVSLR